MFVFLSWCFLIDRMLRRALSYHGILWHAFRRMHGIKKLGLLEREFNESNESLPTATFLQESDSTEFYRKMLRVKAYKACMWLKSEDALFKSLISTIVIGQFQMIMFTFMAWQRDDVHLTEVPPLVRMQHPEYSPVFRALGSLKQLMHTGIMSQSSILSFQEVIRRFSDCSRL